jgi:dCMP deaminase
MTEQISDKMKAVDISDSDQNPTNVNENTTTKRQDYLEWSEYFMAVSFLSAMRSKDAATQVGACIVNPENRIVGIGYNGMPRVCSDDLLPWGKNSREE